MRRCKSTDRAMIRVVSAGIAVLIAVGLAEGADGSRPIDRGDHDHHSQVDSAEPTAVHRRRPTGIPPSSRGPDQHVARTLVSVARRRRIG